MWGTVKGAQDPNWLVAQRWRERRASKFEGEFSKVALLGSGCILPPWSLV